MPNVKRIGNASEQELGILLQKNGYWCHIFEYNANGQPCDIIAIKDNVPFLIDVKHCNTDRFTFDRVESNQQSCFQYANQYCGVSRVGFAIYFENINTWKWLPYIQYKIWRKDHKSINYLDLKDFIDEINSIEQY